MHAGLLQRFGMAGLPTGCAWRFFFFYFFLFLSLLAWRDARGWMSLPSEAALGQEIASASGQLVVVEVWAVWVQTCARFAPTFEAFRADPAFKDRVKFCRVQDTVPGVLDKYKVLAFPSFLFFINGKEVARVRAAACLRPPLTAPSSALVPAPSLPFLSPPRAG